MSSYWIDSFNNLIKFNKIDKNYSTDVCIIGGGITGLTTAYYLTKAGSKVILIDKDDIGKKTSGYTTAKITFQHNLIYDYLINSFGFDFALKYLESNLNAISNIKSIIDSENIACDFEYQDNFVYTTKSDELIKIHNEVKALDNLGLHLSKTQQNLAQFVTDCELPFKIFGAIKVNNQAQFHPVKYMSGLCDCIKKYNGLIFTNSVAKNVNKTENGYVTYVNDYKINSKYIVMASHYPFINFPGFYFSKMYQSTSYALCIDTGTDLFEGMYINPSQPIFSFRSAIKDNKRLLIISGGDHKTGYAPSYNSSYAILEDFAKKHYPKSQVLYKWNTRDCITLDKIPYIGNYSNLMPNAYVATGFNKWGMTSSNVAANIIKDKILGIENDYAFVYDSTRFSPIKNKTEVKNILVQSVRSLVTNKIKVSESDLCEIKKDNGGIIKIEGTNVGIYKDLDGQIFAVNPVCTHLGCLLTWNNIDKTWDCPCHGSRFDYTGKNMYDPAFKNLDTYNIDKI